MPKEYLEIFCEGAAAVIDDFRTLKVFGKKRYQKKSREQDKGHTKEIRAFISAIKLGQTSPVPFEESYLSMIATFKIIESIKSARSISMT